MSSRTVAERLAARRAAYKAGVTEGEGRRARELSTVAIRKQKRAEAMMKRRRGAETDPETARAAEEGTDLVQFRPTEIRLELLAEYVGGT
jgi:hypothetical protein